ncbi:hypothetical protein RFI_39844, partial [Reticulomyxa filosa]
KKRALQDIENFFDEIKQLLQIQKRAALYNVTHYTNEKKNELTNYLKYLQECSTRMNDYINELIFWDSNKPRVDGLTIPFCSNSLQLDQAMYDYDTSVILGLNNDKDNISCSLQQILNQKLVIVEQGSIKVEDIIIQRNDTDNPMALVYWCVDGLTIDDRSSFELEVSSCNENDNNDKWYISAMSPGANTRGVIIINDEKENKLKWGNKYIIRMKFHRFKISQTPFSENYFVYLTDNFIDSNIINAKEIKALESLLPQNYSKVKLLYRGSEYNFDAKAFRNKCNGKEQTIVIVLSELNY